MTQRMLLAAGLVAGLALAYVDSLPTWDDTGVLVGALLLISALLTLLGYRPPWLMALAIGLWTPLHGIFSAQDFRMIAVLFFPLVGAYLGWALRLALGRTLHRA